MPIRDPKREDYLERNINHNQHPELCKVIH